jgi:hypothetical protein
MAVPVFGNLIPVEDAGADDRPVLLLILGTEAARAVPLAEFLLITCQSLDNPGEDVLVRV